MLTEIQGIHILLERWIENPDAPASEISPFTADRVKSRPFTREEIARAAAFLHRLPSLTSNQLEAVLLAHSERIRRAGLKSCADEADPETNGNES